MADKITILKPGEKFVLPKGEEIVSVIQSGGGVALSACADLPITVMKCYSFNWAIADDWQKIDRIIIGSIEVDLDPDYDAVRLRDDINNRSSLLGLAKACYADRIDRSSDGCGIVVGVLNILTPQGSDPQLRVKYMDMPEEWDTYMYIKGKESTGDCGCND